MRGKPPLPLDNRRDLIAVYEYALHSPDPSTQNAAVLRTLDGRLIGPTFACNEFPHGAAITASRLERPLKYEWIEHAERNAIFLAARYGIVTDKLTMVACWASCSDCARALVQAGITTLVRHNPPVGDGSSQRWADSISVGDQILHEGGVQIVEYTEPLPGAPKILRDGALWQP